MSKVMTPVVPSGQHAPDIANAARLRNGKAPPTSPTKKKSGVHVDTTQEDEENQLCEATSKRNVRVAVVGNVDAGKSTLIGTLTMGMLDDGRGRCRTSIMKHPHEIESGRTSTVSTHLMGFRSSGEAIAAASALGDKASNAAAAAGKVHIVRRNKTESDIARESHRVVSLTDLAGHEKYLKTTIHGVSSGFADYALVLVNSRHPPTHMTRHHVNLCCSFGIPPIVVFTKVDGCPEHAMKHSRSEVQRMLRAPDVGRRPFAIRSEDDVDMCIDKMHSLAPMIETSCVSGEGIDLLKKLLYDLPKRRRHERKLQRPFELLVEDVFYNIPGVGPVVSGFVNAGELTVGTDAHVHIGPVEDGSFIKTVAKSAHIARINTKHVTAGQSACLALSLNKELRKKLRRGMVVLKQDNPSATREFDAEICVLRGTTTTIRRSYQTYVHVLSVRQSAFVRRIELFEGKEDSASNQRAAKAADVTDAGRSYLAPDEEGGTVLRPGSRARVHFEFSHRPEYIRSGMRMLFRDGCVRGVGIITATYPLHGNGGPCTS